MRACVHARARVCVSQVCLVVIMFEVTGGLEYVLPVMVHNPPQPGLVFPAAAAGGPAPV